MGTNSDQNNYEFLLTKPAYSSNQLKKLGKALAQGEVTSNSELMKSFLIQHVKLTSEYSLVLFRVLSEAPSFLHPDQFTPFSNWGLELSARVKSEDTLRDKLIRSGHHDLSRVRDVSGLRIQGDISRRNQYLLAQKIVDEFEAIGLETKLIDRIREPIQGYRAIHIEVKAPAGRSEIQLRTRMQSLWANVSENAADIFGCEIRYTNPSQSAAREFVYQLKALSNQNSATEESWNSTFISYERLRYQLKELYNQGVPFRSVLPDGLEQVESTWYKLLDSKRNLEQSIVALKSVLEGVQD